MTFGKVARGFIWALCMALGACGYRFTASGAPLPEGIRELRIPIFVNKTPEPGVETIFTEAFRETAHRAGIRTDELSTARIEGEVRAVSAGLSILKGSTPAGYRLTGVVHLKLLKESRVLNEIDVIGQEDYLPDRDPNDVSVVVGDVLNVEANRQAAIRRLARTLMRDGYERLATGW